MLVLYWYLRNAILFNSPGLNSVVTDGTLGIIGILSNDRIKRNRYYYILIQIIIRSSSSRFFLSRNVQNYNPTPLRSINQLRFAFIPRIECRIGNFWSRNAKIIIITSPIDSSYTYAQCKSERRRPRVASLNDRPFAIVRRQGTIA